MSKNKNWIFDRFKSCPEDRPLIFQLNGNDPEEMLKSA